MIIAHIAESFFKKPYEKKLYPKNEQSHKKRLVKLDKRINKDENVFYIKQ